MHFSERDFPMEYIKKNQVNNKLCIPICMETPYVAPLGLFFSVVDWSKKDFEEDHQMNIPTKCIPISPEVSEKKIQM